MTSTISFVAFKNGEACHVEVTLFSMGLNNETENVMDLFQKMMMTFDLGSAAG
jgi:hypothetical protein